MKAHVALVALFAAACSPPSTEPPANTESMGEPAAQVAVGSITSMGTVTAVDQAAGTVSLDHEAIAAINWPPMSMQFTAEDPAILAGIAVGDRVSFELKSANETSIITVIQRQ